MKSILKAIGFSLLGSVVFYTDFSLAQAQVPEPYAYPDKGQNQQLQQYYNAWTACMEGRGYTVK